MISMMIGVCLWFIPGSFLAAVVWPLSEILAWQRIAMSLLVLWASDGSMWASCSTNDTIRYEYTI